MSKKDYIKLSVDVIRNEEIIEIEIMSAITKLNFKELR